MSSNEIIEDLANSSEGFTGADLQGLVNNIQMLSLQEHIKSTDRQYASRGHGRGLLSHGSLREGQVGWDSSNSEQKCQVQSQVEAS